MRAVARAAASAIAPAAPQARAKPQIGIPALVARMHPSAGCGASGWRIPGPQGMTSVGVTCAMCAGSTAWHSTCADMDCASRLGAASGTPNRRRRLQHSAVRDRVARVAGRLNQNGRHGLPFRTRSVAMHLAARAFRWHLRMMDQSGRPRYRPASSPEPMDKRMARRIELTPETWHALDELQYETGQPLHELAEEAFVDLIKKRRQPRSLREALSEVAQRHHPSVGH